MQEFTIPSLAFFLNVVKPNFADLVPTESSYTGILNEFTLMDNVVSSRTIVDISRKRNILTSRDAGCTLDYRRVASANTRKISVQELAGAATHCKHDFYQGCLRDFRNNNPLFGGKIATMFKDIIYLDLAGGAHFGDTSRASVPGYGLNDYDGIWTWIQNYFTAGVIPAGQSYANPNTDLRANPTDAKNILEALYDSMPPLMRAQGNLRFYVSQPVYDGYMKWLQQTSQGVNVMAQYQNGIQIVGYNGIPIMVEPLWEDILLQISPAGRGNAAVLTTQGNFVFATDKNYGEEDPDPSDDEGSSEDVAFRLWYEKKELSWYYQAFLKAGTQLALPEFVCFSI